MTVSVASTGSSPSGVSITSFTLAGVKVQPNQLLVAFVNSVDGALDFDNEQLLFAEDSPMTLDKQQVINPFQLSKYSYYNNTGSAITGDLVVDWGGDTVSRTAIAYAIIDNAHPTAHHHLDYVVDRNNDDSPAISITPTINNTLILTSAICNVTNTYTWSDTLDETVDMQASYQSFLCEFNQSMAAAHTNTGTVGGSPGTAETRLMMVSVAPADPISSRAVTLNVGEDPGVTLGVGKSPGVTIGV